MLSEALNIEPKTKEKELLQLINAQKCVVFIGSGLSSEIYPSWEQLVQQLCQECSVANFDPKCEYSSDELLKLAQNAKDNDEEKYFKELKKIFKREGGTTNIIYQYLLKLKFKSYITTNYDSLLKEAAELAAIKCGELYHRDFHFDINNRNLFYIHGYIDPMKGPEKWGVILTKKDFEYAYNPRLTLYSFLHQLFIYENILFIGCSLKEPQIEKLVEICNDVRKNINDNFYEFAKPKRYILLPFEYIKLEKSLSDIEVIRNFNKENEEKRRFETMDICVLRYNRVDQKHSGLRKVLQKWSVSNNIEPTCGFEPNEQNEIL